MNNQTITTISHHCEIILAGHLDQRFLPWVENMQTLLLPNGTTMIIFSLVDQAALFGALNRIRDLGCPLISLLVAPPQIKFNHNPASKQTE